MFTLEANDRRTDAERVERPSARVVRECARATSEPPATDRASTNLALLYEGARGAKLPGWLPAFG